VAIAIVTVCLVLLGILVWRAPDAGHVPEPGCSIWTQVADAVSPLRPGNVLPEVDQLMLGFTIVPFLDPLFTGTQASHLKRWAAEIYAELERDADFHDLGSILPDVASECLGLGENRGHAYLYIPRGIDPVPAPSRARVSAWERRKFQSLPLVAVAGGGPTDLVIVAPSFGLGNWQSPDTEKTWLQRSSRHEK